ncbi:MAG: hypothetical protein KC519_19230 [Anaerolineae bacterium]|nr:hypothetical protein [Anaerolineae bacterium]
MDLYIAKRLSDERIKSFQDAAEHDRLVREARGEDERKPRQQTMMSRIGLMMVISRIGGAGLS